MTKRILPAPKLSHSKRALRLSPLPLHERSRPVYASTLRFSTVISPTIPDLPPLISPLSLKPSLTPLILQQPGTDISDSDTIGNGSPRPSPSNPRPRFRPKQDRTKRAIISVANTMEPRPPYPLSTKWRCHVCGRRYAIGVIRRCLRDGHFLCFPKLVESSQVKSNQMRDQTSVEDKISAEVSLEEGRNEKAKAVIAMRQRIKARYRLLTKANRVSKGCAVTFDYNGWSVYGSWKREGKSGLGMPCENGFDWPGECRERERRAEKEMRKLKRQEKVVQMVTYSHHFCSVL
ncbi:hypothetical protein V496_05924 [Pseudogymnoascus sp. VKM F-4515 (FW-2607)]|nr:hypothetical protein V496_05924 [Pseudogymnoascus sp. VKM F-4515 (FW-2607)]KFY92585.1 hypothetical protein V498_04847 [Pseudogymnoascus sp. VKM F-4517 (FW-2822)]